MEQVLDALAYLILHLAKIKANKDEFEAVFVQSGLNPTFMSSFSDAVLPHLEQMRQNLASEVDKNQLRFRNLDWRLNLVTACRAKQRITHPKYTVQLDLEKIQSEKQKQEGEEQAQQESFVLDTDYNSLKRIQKELEDALKAVDSQYSKKVFKFLK